MAISVKGVHKTLEHFTPLIENYSIDEAFLDLRELKHIEKFISKVRKDD